jgi:N-acetyl-alpha-D-muramate 1-phosphate uridylyltransferase
MPTNALILAAGRGERMRPLTDSTPKPLLFAGGKRLIEWQIEALAKAGVRRIVINTAHLPQQFEDVLGDGARYGASWPTRAKASVRRTRWRPSAESFAHCRSSATARSSSPAETSSRVTTTRHSPSRRARSRPASSMRTWCWSTTRRFTPQGDMALIDGRVDPDGGKRLTYANIGVFSPALFTGLQPVRARLFPWLYGAARAGRVSGEHARVQWFNVGSPDELARADAELRRAGP